MRHVFPLVCLLVTCSVAMAGEHDFRDTDMNECATSLVEGIATIAKQDDPGEIGQTLASLAGPDQRLVGLLYTEHVMDAKPEDYIAYQALLTRLDEAIKPKAASGVKGKRIAGAYDNWLAEHEQKLAFDKREGVERVVLHDGDRYLTFCTEIKTFPQSEKELTEGYADCCWTLPWVDGQKMKDPQIILVPSSVDGLPAIVSNPEIAPGYSFVSAVAFQRFGNDRLKKRFDNAESAKVWKQAMELREKGKPATKAEWPQRIMDSMFNWTD